MNASPTSVAKQISIERRFNCVICLCARFQMVYGRCQHRICTKCAYGANGILRRQFSRCPSCQQEDAFPDKKPTIPEDNVEMQKLLGVTACQNRGCNQEFWSWEKSEHDLTCPYKNSPPREKSYSDSKKRHSMTNTLKNKKTQPARIIAKRDYILRSKHNLSQSRIDDYAGYFFRKRSHRSPNSLTLTQ